MWFCENFSLKMIFETEFKGKILDKLVKILVILKSSKKQILTLKDFPSQSNWNSFFPWTKWNSQAIILDSFEKSFSEEFVISLDARYSKNSIELQSYNIFRYCQTFKLNFPAQFIQQHSILPWTQIYLQHLMNFASLSFSPFSTLDSKTTRIKVFPGAYTLLLSSTPKIWTWLTILHFLNLTFSYNFSVNASNKSDKYVL